MFNDADEQTLASILAWRDLPAKHQPDWPDKAELERLMAYLRTLPPLVFAGEADKLKQEMAAAGRGQAFVLMGGDCAESFADSSADRIRARIRTILQMAAVLTYAASVPVVKIGRMAGQFAKPRSNPFETRDGVTLPSYMGDAVNGHEFTREARTPDPHRLIEAYQRSVSTLNLVRAFTTGGFADLAKVHEWNKGFMANPAYAKYEAMAGEIDRAMRFMKAAGVSTDSFRTVDLYSSHEALLLPYEEAMTRIDSRTGTPYNTSAHFLWIGERTRDIGGAHVEMLSRVRNPIGVKLGPRTTVADAIALIDKLNPEGEPGRLTFITRMGADKIRDCLPPLVEGVARDGRPVTWVTDPMHGNTITAKNGLKTRRLSDIMREIQGFFAVHQELDTHPGGIHVELTGDDVTEVLGGSEEVVEDTLEERYETLVDPRLNHQQSLEMAFLVAEQLRDIDI
ncbi:MAG: 3-deoxy-7-phosphoheptulonate synthase class II [Ancrocorticia sp.]|jgi:3-deoxy-7-phosphoheptulonate synthase|nr:3-deoxy-7-phosphoheptulonate synthase class II [Ancrocorticia sp.]MCI2178849.1 3-deoxy-7-phosphoheptulonate synthase class II [Ancrocorticia sp.]MCI2192829.1 3-deoxy-7-phosphoheptulonate synthase class II [Ancrocorticia sp.]MCI2198264.1 3-deoxy-7-phosphoheptulonate synthase class II [Ancrocorticia sp.]